MTARASRRSGASCFAARFLLNYSRIQDIHLRSNLVERWLGLAWVQIQTASGSSEPELTIEGATEFEAVRDFLYARMRGARDDSARRPNVALEQPATAPVELRESARGDPAELAATLREVCQELREVRRVLEERKPAVEDAADGQDN